MSAKCWPFYSCLNVSNKFLKSEITFKHIGEQTEWESVNSLISGEYGYYLELVIFELISRIDFLSISCENAMKQMPQDLNDHKLTLIQVICHYRTSPGCN